MNKYQFGVLGVGKMGSSFLQGVLNNNVFDKSMIAIYTLEEDVKDKYRKMGLHVCDSEKELFISCNIILIAIKPQNYDETLKKLLDIDYSDKAIISIAPGKTIDYLQSYFNDAFIVRAMPNTPALINRATVTYAINKESNYLNDVNKILGSIGEYVKVEEWQIDEGIPLNGSMPAYIFEFAKVFIDCGVKHGFSYEDSKKLALNSIIGSCKLALNSDDDLQTLINNVCSKGGTTIAGLEKLQQNGFDKAIEECFDACVKRSKELGK